MYGAISTHQPSDRPDGDTVSQRFTLGALLRDYGEQYIEKYRPNAYQIKWIRAVRLCKTPAMGGQQISCNKCGSKHYMYHSCGHSQCPLCQSIKRAQWQDKLGSRLLKVPYIHGVFTLPHELNRLIKRNKSQLYSLLMRSCWQTVKLLTKDPNHVGGLPAMISVLHTFGSDMKYHVHVHSLITFGGLGKEGVWYWPKRKKKLAPFRLMSSRFRDVFLTNLEGLIKRRKIEVGSEWRELSQTLRDKRWNVRTLYPTMNTELIEGYLARYINRVAISPSRLTYLKREREVQIIYHDYKNQKKGKAAPKAIKSMHPLDAIHQMVSHVLPPHFQKARYYGLHASATYKQIKDLLPDKLKRNGYTIRTVFQILYELLKIRPHQCEVCGSGDYSLLEIRPDRQYKFQFLSLSNGRSPPTINP